MDKTHIVYEDLVFFHQKHFIPFWIAVGIILFLQQEIIVRISGETQLLSMRILISLFVSIAVIIFVDLGNRFRSIMESVNAIVKFPNNDVDGWIDQKIDDFGTFNNMIVRIFILFIVVGFVITVLFLGLPYNSTIANIDFLLSLLPFLIIGGHLIYSGIGVLLILDQIILFPLKNLFFITKHPSVIDLSRFYYRSAIYALFIVFWLTLGIWQNPYGFTFALLAWLVSISFIPLFLFLWTAFRIHQFMSRIKQNNILIINNQVQHSLNAVVSKTSKDSASKLETLMKIQKMVESMHEWPFSLQGISTLFAAIIFPMVNIIIVIIKMPAS